MQAIAAPTFADTFRPTKAAAGWTYDVFLVLCGTLLIAVCAKVQIPLWPVPITGQTFAIVLIGALFGPWRGAATVLAYLAEGAIGLPVFAGGAGGFLYMFGPTGGYLMGFVPAAFVVGLLARRGWDRNVHMTALAMSIGTAVIFIFGLAWLHAIINLGRFEATSSVLMMGFYPYLPGAVIKIALAAALLPSGWKLLGMLRR